MRYSDDRLTYLSQQIHGRLSQNGLVSYPDQDKAMREIKRALVEYFRVEDEVDEMVREKIGKLKRGVVEGSPEWDVLYHKYFEEEMNKRGR